MSDRKLLFICDKKTWETDFPPIYAHALSDEIRNIWTISVFNTIELCEKKSKGDFTYKNRPQCIYDNRNSLLHKSRNCDILLYKGWENVILKISTFNTFINLLKTNNCRVIGDKRLIIKDMWEKFKICGTNIEEEKFSDKQTRFEMLDIRSDME